MKLLQANGQEIKLSDLMAGNLPAYLRRGSTAAALMSKETKADIKEMHGEQQHRQAEEAAPVSFPEELFWSFEKLFNDGGAEKLKKKNLTAYCAVLWYWYSIEENALVGKYGNEMNRAEFTAYIAEIKARRVAELQKMGYESAYGNPALCDEFCDLDKAAYNAHRAKYQQEHMHKTKGQ